MDENKELGKDLGGWSAIEEKFFAEGAIFDQIIRER